MSEMLNINPEIAMRHYRRVKEANKRYYERNKADIAERRRLKYREEHPNPNPVGRPKKEAGPTGPPPPPPEPPIGPNGPKMDLSSTQ